MSNLSDLLNPTSNPAAGAPSTALQSEPLDGDGQVDPTDTSQTQFSNAQSPVNYAVISPGLDALAAAASNTLPLFSPAQDHSLTAEVMRVNAVVKEAPPTETQASLEPNTQRLAGPPGQHHASGRDQQTQVHTKDTGKPLLQTYSSISTENQASELDHSVSAFQNHPELSDTRETSQLLPSYSSQRLQHGLPGQTEQIHIKAESAERPDVEMTDNSSPLNQSSTQIQCDPTPGTPLKNVMSNTSPAPASRNEDASTVPPKSKSGPPKKRGAPKKGTAVKPPSKKRKIETGSGKASPRTGTPATSRASGTPVPKKGKQESATPTRSSSVANQDDDDDDEDELFCVCRKPDDHTVMIGCDGPCEDWFHIRCVSMTGDKVALISKWYCPNCAEEGHETEWKRMCRLASCTKPARVEGPHRSKYCSDEHGQEFMRSHISMDERASSTASNNRRKRRDNYTDHFANESDEQDEPDENRGGILRLGELKTLIDGVSDVVAFRKLGDGVLSPLETAATSPQRDTAAKIGYSAEESSILNDIKEKRTQIEGRRQMLDDRATLVQLVEIRRKNVLAKLKEKEKSLKDICGYDARLAWSDVELNNWRTSKEGKEQLFTTVLHADPKLVEKGEEEGDDAEVGLGVCKKKRCERHRTWFKVQQADLAMEKDDVRQGLRKLDEEEKGVKERAMIRSLEEAQAGASET